MYSQTCLNRYLIETICSVRSKKGLDLCRLNKRRFHTLGHYSKFDLYKIPVYLGFGLDRFRCTKKCFNVDNST